MQALQEFTLLYLALMKKTKEKCDQGKKEGQVIESRDQLLWMIQGLALDNSGITPPLKYFLERSGKLTLTY